MHVHVVGELAFLLVSAQRMKRSKTGKTADAYRNKHIFSTKAKKKGNKKKGRCVKPLVYNCRYSVRQYSASSANNCREIQEIACAGRATFLSPEPDRDLIF